MCLHDKDGNLISKEEYQENQSIWGWLGDMVAGAARYGSATGRNTVRLSPTQVQIAKKLGVPLEEYAKQVQQIAAKNT